MGDVGKSFIGMNEGSSKGSKALFSALTGGISETNMAAKAKQKREKDKQASQNVIDNANAMAASIEEQAATAEETALATARLKADKRRTSQTKTLLSQPGAASGTVQRKSLLGQ